MTKSDLLLDFDEDGVIALSSSLNSFSRVFTSSSRISPR